MASRFATALSEYGNIPTGQEHWAAFITAISEAYSHDIAAIQQSTTGAATAAASQAANAAATQQAAGVKRFEMPKDAVPDVYDGKERIGFRNWSF